MTGRIYASPLAFKPALEQRLRATTTNGTAFSRKRQILVFERFLARVSLVHRLVWALRGAPAERGAPEPPQPIDT